MSEISTDIDTHTDTLNTVNIPFTASVGVSSLANITENYNGIENVFILKGQSANISSIPSSITGPRTYIIEDGDLVISGNLVYDGNIAFIIKGGNVRIDNSVTQIDAVLVVMEKSSV
ncbi:MAG: hypothetical protein H6767_07060 [Candidatus Peribacteria bacterium]|nr:MAG: hypothetical protein H6767_07060 [Candidatus Peribacteria bacterium]